MIRERLNQAEARLGYLEDHLRNMEQVFQRERFDQAEARVQNMEERIQHLDGEYHRTLTDFQWAVAEQWEVTNGVAATAREMLTTAGQMLDADGHKLRS
jgi:septation ring formation regulator EzrA